uniref:Reverse transcriptase domain-containing protein n=1 Tax=Tanacetum cinerariifolium TaxID=118510 RepID=A0A6L2MSS4_TANCI|nr:hypothetical protein [Tanacetum cinerariifolium]
MYINTPNWDRPIVCYDEDYAIVVIPSLSTEEPDNSLTMGDEHLDTIPITESNEFIKSSVKNFIPIPSESEGIPDNMCDVPFHNNSPPLDILKGQFEDFFDSNNEFSSTDDDSFSIDNIEYVEASPPDSELVSSEVMEIVIPKKEISSGSTTTRFDISLPEYKAFYDHHVKEISSGSTTIHSDSSLYDSFIFDLSINPFPPADRSGFMSSPMNSLTSYFHQTMIVSSSRLNATQGISPWMWRRGCALLRKKFKENLFTYCIENGILQDSFEPSNDNTNVANSLRDPFVGNQDPSKNSLQSPPQINHHCCYEYGDPLEDIYCHQCTCQLRGRGAHYGYNCPLKPFHYSIITQPPQEEMNVEFLRERRNEMDSVKTFLRKFNRISFYEMPKVLSLAWETILEIKLAFEDKHCQPEDILELFQRLQNDVQITPSLSTEEPDNSLSMGDEHLDTILATESDEFIKSSVENFIPNPSESEGIPDNMCDVPFHDNSPSFDVLKGQFEDFSYSNDEFYLTDDDSFSIDNIEYVEASPPDSELVSSEVMEIVIPKVGGIDDDIILTIIYDILHEKLLNINLLIANIEALNDNPTPSSDFMTTSFATSLNSLLEESNTFDNSLPEFETFCFNLKEISSGSTTTRFDISLLEYEAFYDDHVKEISSGSTTTRFDISLLEYEAFYDRQVKEISSGSTTIHSDSSPYDSFIFDLSINPFPPADRSGFYEFADELTHIISLPEYDCFFFKIERNSGDFTMDVAEDISPTREPRVHNALPTHPILQLNMKFIHSSESLFTYVVWIFLPFLLYSVAPQYLQSFWNEDTIIDPGICNYHFFSFMLDVSHRCGTFPRLKVLNESLMEILSSTCSLMDQ